MLLIGLTGGIGSGKSTVAHYFNELGIEVIDADVIAREVVAPGTEILQQIVAHFGADILDKNGHLLRGKLRELIFSDNKKKHWLEELLHPIIKEKMWEKAETAHSPYCILVIPLLLEKNLKVDRILVVDAPLELQILRAQKRDNVETEAIHAILQTQISQQERLAHANDIIHNTGSFTDLKQQVVNLHEKYLALIKKS